MEKKIEHKDETKTGALEGGIEKNVFVDVEKLLEQINNLEDDLYRLKNSDNEKIYNRIDGLIANNKNEIAYLKSRQREQELEIKNRHENVKRLQEQKKAIRREERERQKLYNKLKSDNIGLTKINVSTNKTSNYHPLVKNVEPLIKSKQNQLVNQDEKNRLKNEYRASLFYPDDTEETKLYLAKQTQIAEEQKREQKAQLEKQIDERNNTKTLQISDVEKTLFPDGNLAEMDFAKSNELSEMISKKEKDKFSFVDSIKKSILADIDLIKRVISASYKVVKNENPSLEIIIEKFFKCTDERYKTLKEKIKLFLGCDNLTEFIMKFDSYELEEMIRDYLKGTELSYSIARKNVGEDAAALLKISGKDANLNIPYTKESTIYESSNYLPNKYKIVVQEKLISQNMPLQSKGILFHSNSEIATRLIDSVYLKKYVKDHINDISFYCSYIGSNERLFDGSIVFEKGNFYYAIRKADIRNLQFDLYGNLTGDLIDTIDFDEDNGDRTLKNDNSLNIVVAARNLQLKGEIEPKFIIVHFVIPPSKLEKILN